MKYASNIRLNETRIFQGEIGPGENIAQFYADDGAFLEALTIYVASGLCGGQSVIVIATLEHLRALRERLIWARIDLASAIIEDRYITLNAETALSAFLVGGWPDEDLFRRLVSHLFKRATANERSVRAFGEMVALLWARGFPAATVRLEQLWGRFCEESEFSLFFAYPSAGFPESASRSLAEICAAHSRVIGLPRTEAAGPPNSPARSQPAD